MYEDFYNFRAMPFQITSDPRFLWLGEKHAEALATLKYGILENKGFLLLTGDVGTGKTALVNRLIKMIDVAAIIAKLPDPGLDSLDFFNFLSVEFKMNKKFDSKGAFLIHLKDFLHKAYANHKSVLLIIDEAQRLNHDLLEQIRLLSNIELQNRKLISIFFVGQPEFSQMLMEERNRAVRQRISISYHIEPLTKAETYEYIKHRLKVAGVTRGIFSKDAVREIFSFTAGYPRLINIICDHALLTGYASGLKSIDRKVILECEREQRIPLEAELNNGQAASETDPVTLAGTPQPDRSSFLKRTGFGAALLMLLILVIYFFANQGSEEAPRWGMEEIAPQKYQGPLPAEPGSNSIRNLAAGKPQAADPQPVQESGSNDLSVRKIIQAPKSDNPSKPATAQPANEPDDESQLQSSTPDTTAAAESVNSRARDAAPLREREFTLYFKRNSNELPDESFAILNRIADFMVKKPESTLEVKGYTDSTGRYSYNVSVSEFRANTIKLFLIGRGIDPSKIKTFGLGPKDPIATNQTAEGRQQNRRVELEVKSD